MPKFFLTENLKVWKLEGRKKIIQEREKRKEKINIKDILLQKKIPLPLQG
ncbi:hypothetical protein GV828_01135 [Flavobacterium sp. NST-5]|uniref:Uncharacterized protein n=1 Tax=Flavobacterium ichthyis TaxID=2698827 RepID=A0ABW9Z4P0_9FLAO|nr:hypothetical protein [Flavobacterium ichthyis]